MPARRKLPTDHSPDLVRVLGAVKGPVGSGQEASPGTDTGRILKQIWVSENDPAALAMTAPSARRYICPSGISAVVTYPVPVTSEKIMPFPLRPDRSPA